MLSYITQIFNAPIPIGHSTTLNEKYAIKTVLQHLKDEHHQWVICVCLCKKGELFVGSPEWVHKVSLHSMLLGQQG